MLYPEVILSAAGFNWNVSVACTDLTVFCRALFSLCIPPDMINVLFHIYSRVWRESWGGNVFECWGFTAGTCSVDSLTLLAFAGLFLVSFYVLVSGIRGSLQWVYCGCSAYECTERKLWVFLTNRYDSQDEKFDDTCIYFTTALCVLSPVSQTQWVSVHRDVFCFLQPSLNCSSIEQRKKNHVFPLPHSSSVLQIKMSLVFYH